MNNTGIGYALSGDLFTAFPATFAGVTVQSDETLLRYTLYGDTNLDRIVDIGDFASVAANFNITDSTWFKGDFNYDQITEIADFALLAANFNQALGDVPRGMAVPEPVVGALMAVAVAFGRRRRKAWTRLVHFPTDAISE